MSRDETIRPESAKMTPGLDCKLFTAYDSGCSMISRLVACEKGIKWENYDIDILDKLDNILPWYLDLNPVGVVPTLLTQDGTIINDSLNIIRYIEDNYDGPSLLPVDSSLLMEKYEHFLQTYQKWNAFSFTFGYLFGSRPYMKNFGFPHLV